MQNPDKRSGRFKRTSELLKRRINEASEGRGFSETRLLTHWSTFVGIGLAEKTYPVKISFASGGLGATLTILTTGPHALELEMLKHQIKDKVNAAYGYNAVARIKITQTAETGFEFAKVNGNAEEQGSNTKLTVVRNNGKASEQVEGVENKELREALAELEEKVLTKSIKTIS
jgi:hypothetical protein